jgi:hypothetical protein
VSTDDGPKRGTNYIRRGAAEAARVDAEARRASRGSIDPERVRAAKTAFQAALDAADDPEAFEAAQLAGERSEVMAAVLRDVWQLAQRWQRDDDTEPLAGDIFTAVSPLVAWEAERGLPSTFPDASTAGGINTHA